MWKPLHITGTSSCLLATLAAPTSNAHCYFCAQQQTQSCDPHAALSPHLYATPRLQSTHRGVGGAHEGTGQTKRVVAKTAAEAVVVVRPIQAHAPTLQWQKCLQHHQAARRERAPGARTDAVVQKGGVGLRVGRFLGFPACRNLGSTHWTHGLAGAAIKRRCWIVDRLTSDV